MVTKHPPPKLVKHIFTTLMNGGLIVSSHLVQITGINKKRLKASDYFGYFLRLFLRGSLSPAFEGGIHFGRESGVANTGHD